MITKSRREYFQIVIVCTVALGLFVFSPKGNTLWPVAVIILGSLFYFQRHADFYTDYVEVTYTLRRKKIKVAYKEIQKVRYRPAVFRSPPTLVIWFEQNGKTVKLAFPIKAIDGLLLVDLIKVNSPGTMILDPWDDKPFREQR